MFIPTWRSVLLRSVAAAGLLGAASIGAAQPLRPPSDDQGSGRPATAEPAREPGYLGLVTDDRREQGAGVRVLKVVEGSPAAQAGFEVDDLIVAIDGKRVGSLDDMSTQLEPHAANERARFEVRRGDAVKALDVTLGRRPARGERPFEFGRIPGRLPEPAVGGGPAAPPPVAGAPAEIAPPAEPLGRGQLLGIRSGIVSEATRQRLHVPEAGGALVVARVVGSPADKAGIPLDAVVVAVDGRPVGSPTDLARLISAAGPGNDVELTYYSGGERRKAVVTLANAPSQLPPPPDAGPMADPRAMPRPGERQVAPPANAAERIERLERRVRELELRVQELERAGRAVELDAPRKESVEGNQT